jgi:hypothetical protein
MENSGLSTNPVLARVLEHDGASPLGEVRARHAHDHREALPEAYPIVEGRIDPDILAFDYKDTCAGTPVEWWYEYHWLLTRFMRLAQERGASELIKMLEPLRERAAAQILQADRDLEERWVAPRRAAREEAGE